MADPPTWRWNMIPDYDLNTKEILEQRLRNKFGNWKFYVERRPQHWRFWVPRDLTEAVDQVIGSCGRHREYPSNLVDPGSLYRSILEEYRQRITRRASKLFCPDRQAAVEFFHYDEARKGFKSDTPSSLRDLQQCLPCAAGQVQLDKPCSFVFIGAQSSRDVLRISHWMMLWVLSVFQVLPMFLDFLFPFGKQLYALDFQFSGFREDNRLGAQKRSEIIELGRSGQDFQICYNLKTVEAKDGQAWPWSPRQAAVFHSFDVKNGQASWIVIKANNVIRNRLKEAMEARLVKDANLYQDQDICKQLSNTLAGHLVLAEWSGENWRWYINYLEEQLENLTRRAIVDKVTKFSSFPLSNSVPSVPSNTLAPQRRTWTWRGAFSRTNTTNAQAQGPVQLQGLAPAPTTIAVHEPDDPPNMPPDFDPKLGDSEEEEEKDGLKIDNLQDAQFLEGQANEAVLILKSNISVLNHIREYYTALCKSLDLSQNLRDGVRMEVLQFAKRVQSIQNDLKIHIDRMETIIKLAADRKDLLYGLLEYQSMQANKKFAIQAQRSAQRMEEMTREMQDLTLKTTLETVLMRIITVVTVFFLPATFVSTLMSTDIVNFVPHDSSITSGSTSLGAVKLFLCLSLALMVATLAAGTGLYWWAVRYGVKR